MTNPLQDFAVDRAQIRTIGHDLQRPECILAERDGTLWSADARGGVMRIDPNGTQQLIAPKADKQAAIAAALSAYGTLAGGATASAAAQAAAAAVENGTAAINTQQGTQSEN